MHALGQFGLAVLAISLATPLWAQTPAASAKTTPEPAANLISDVVYNETHAPERSRLWEYRSERVTPDQHVVREQVETAQGTVFRVVEQNGAPLDETQQQQEEERIDQYVRDPGQMARIEKEHHDDEDRLMKGLDLLPKAMLFDYKSAPTADVAEIAFRPNPAYSPSGFEAHVVHALTGTVLVNTRSKRLIEIRGVLTGRVDVGLGLVGHLQKGGTFVVHRREVADAAWKTDVVEVHLDGKILLLKSFSKDQRETRSDFRPVPASITPLQAKEILEAAASQVAQMHLVPAAVDTAR